MPPLPPPPTALTGEHWKCMASHTKHGMAPRQPPHEHGVQNPHSIAYMQCSRTEPIDSNTLYEYSLNCFSNTACPYDFHALAGARCHGDGSPGFPSALALSRTAMGKNTHIWRKLCVCLWYTATALTVYIFLYVHSTTHDWGHRCF